MQNKGNLGGTCLLIYKQKLVTFGTVTLAWRPLTVTLSCLSDRLVCAGPWFVVPVVVVSIFVPLISCFEDNLQREKKKPTNQSHLFSLKLRAPKLKSNRIVYKYWNSKRFQHHLKHNTMISRKRTVALIDTVEV